VCLRIKYGYKAAEALPTSPPVTISRRSKLRGERAAQLEREAEEHRSREGRERELQASNLSPLP